MSTAPPEAVAAAAPPPPDAAAPRAFMERLLSPQGIHALLGTGGGLFVIGLVTWLVTLGVFDHPLALATALGGANLAILFAGFWLVLKTRFHLAGVALTLLSCLLMPLHLWLYHAQGLLTFDNHLWAAALVISLLYAITARVLRNIWFVPIFLGGIALTTMLILADAGQFWQITAPAIALCLLGLGAIHSERLFTQDAGSPFRRDQFGLAFFWSGHVLLALGLLMVLVAQLAGGPLYETCTKSLYTQWNVSRTDLVTTQAGKLTALLLVLAGVYGHLYSDLIVRRKGYYLQAAALLLIWIEFIVIDLLQIPVQKEMLLGIFAATGLLLQLLHRYLGYRLPSALPILPFMACLLSVGSMVAGLLFYFAENTRFLSPQLPSVLSINSWPILLVSMTVTLLSLLFGSVTSKDKEYARFYRSSTSLGAWLLAAMVILVWTPASWFVQAGCILPWLSGRHSSPTGNRC